MTGIARTLHTQLVHYFRTRVNYNDSGISGGVYVGTLPAGAMVIDAVTRVNTAFNAGTTNVLTAGTNSASYDNIIGAGDVTEGTPGGYRAAILTAGATAYAADTDIYVKYTQTGTAADAGQADIIITFAPNNDG
jgi:hypothetical protein